MGLPSSDQKLQRLHWRDVVNLKFFKHVFPTPERSVTIPENSSKFVLLCELGWWCGKMRAASYIFNGRSFAAGFMLLADLSIRNRSIL